ncbi:MAG: hypothetical protein Q4D85_07425 [Corynebacterium sp.]|uniref:hypothetical protein n=1 Tax=Corynebacterium sp. TaxID=1720 RepID=UPI0026DABEFA|nr:hypothetical protein [Corynebacterium sp.]MDO5098578.1 hypothetical protein [Corynebacterium sp.]
MTIYIRLDMTIPGAGSTTHIAELEEIDDSRCAMLRIIELDPHGVIHGGATNGVVVGLAAPPQDVVPHPRSYTDFPDIETTEISEADFDALWAEAIAKFPELS